LRIYAQWQLSLFSRCIIILTDNILKNINIKSNESSAEIPTKRYIPILKGIVDIFIERSRHRLTQDLRQEITGIAATFSSQDRTHEFL